MRRHRTRLRPIRIGFAGYSLVEVVVAMLISCVMLTAVMGVAVTAKQGGGKSMHRLAFDQGISQLSAELKSYVTACGCRADTGACPGGGLCDDPGINGPNTNRAGVAQWYINGAPGAGTTGKLIDTYNGSAGADVWALACGDHVITGLFPPPPSPLALESAPYGGSIKYTVGWPDINAAGVGSCAVGLPGINDAPTIKFMANWSEP